MRYSLEKDYVKTHIKGYKPSQIWLHNLIASCRLRYPYNVLRSPRTEIYVCVRERLLGISSGLRRSCCTDPCGSQSLGVHFVVRCCKINVCTEIYIILTWQINKSHNLLRRFNRDTGLDGIFVRTCCWFVLASLQSLQSNGTAMTYIY